MRLFEKYVAAGRYKNLEALADIFNEDYMYSAPTYLQTKESILEEFEKSWLEKTFINTESKLIHDDEDTMILTFIKEDFRKNIIEFVTGVVLLKDGQMWRSASKAEPID